MMKSRFILVAMLSVTCVGCTPKNLKLEAPRTYFPEQVDQAGTHLTATNGEKLITSLALYRNKALTLAEPFNTSGKFGRVDYSITLPKDRYVLRTKTNNGTELYYAEHLIYFKATGSSGYVVGGMAKDADAKLSVFWCPTTRAPKCFFDNLAEQPPSTEASFNDFKDTDGFLATISYLGLVQGQMKFVYNEYQDARIRASFTQEFSFDYALGKELAFKEARFIVNRASTNDIDITLIHPL